MVINQVDKTSLVILHHSTLGLNPAGITNRKYRETPINKGFLDISYKEISTYAQGLKDVSKFIVIDPKELMFPIKDTHSDLYNYLDARYWST